MSHFFILVNEIQHVLGAKKRYIVIILNYYYYPTVAREILLEFSTMYMEDSTQIMSLDHVMKEFRGYISVIQTIALHWGPF